MRIAGRVTAVAVALSLLLTAGGCTLTASSGDEVRLPAPSAGPVAPPLPSSPTMGTEIEELPDGEVASLGQLVAALEGIGIDCSNWVQSDDVAGSEESGWCADQWGLSTFATKEDRNGVLRLSGASVEPQEFLVGVNWLVTRGYEDPADLETVRRELGGEFWRPGDALPR